MHRCLQIPELAELICEQGFYDTDTESWRAILTLAQTCRSLYEPAANVVWHHIPSLKSILDIVPASQWAAVDQLGDCCPIEPTNFERLRAAAMRVRVIGYSPGEFDAIADSPDVPPFDDSGDSRYKLLSAVIGSSTPLLPNLRMANLINPDPSLFLHANLFMHPTMIHFWLLACIPDGHDSGGCGDDGCIVTTLRAFLSHMSRNYSSLKILRLDIRGVSEGGPVATYLEDAIIHGTWESLTTIIIEANSSVKLLADTLRHSSVKRLSVQVSSTERVTRLPTLDFERTGSSLMPCLEDVTLAVPWMSLMVDFLHSLSPRTSPIHSAFLWSNMPENSTTRDWEQLFQCVRDQFDPSILEVLSIDDSITHDEQRLRDIIAINTFTVPILESGLFGFKCLVDLTINTIGILPVDDEVLGCMVEAWPQLQALQLWGQHLLNLPPKVTVQGLALLADKCPNLTTLVIEINADVTTTSRPGPRPAFGKKLNELDVLRSPISSPAMFAAFLSDVFPQIGILKCRGEYGEIWGRAFELYPIFLSTRKDELARAQDELGFVTSHVSS